MNDVQQNHHVTNHNTKQQFNAGVEEPQHTVQADASPVNTEPVAIPIQARSSERAQRKTIRARLNDEAGRKLIFGVSVTILGGTFWGLSGTTASYLFQNYHLDVMWLTSIRQFFAGVLFMLLAFAREREKLKQMWTTPAHRRELLLFALLGIFGNQVAYLMTVKLTNPGTATVLQCLQLLIVMVISCIRLKRLPRKREVAGVALALLGTYLIATGGNPTSLAIPFDGLVLGLLTAAAAAFIVVAPVNILPHYGSTVVTGSAMFSSGILACALAQPWNNLPHLGADGILALIILIVVGSFLAYQLYLQGVKEIGSMRASLLGTVEPISATVLSAIFLGTVFAPTDLIGFALIIAMVFLTV
ncbi:DMT family transporter [Collinsella sp. zg1085]|uniref:DMT family transporter n=1 Tax=Collinsella sp. zg1085 TaxID=2844380 RepID=UPI001C0C91D9|nr:DMT family transporter [Collinsella sp. zg1085]QWT17741.1 DMT family transporter [Collinsella sp. zg1085]